MLNIDFWTIFWTVVNILVLYAIFRLFLYKPVMKVIEAREKMIQQQFDSADQSRQEALQMKAEYEKELSSAKEEADQIILAARERAEEEHRNSMENTRKEAEHMLERARADIAREQKEAAEAARDEIANLAVLAARKILKTGDIHDAGSSK